MLNCFSFYSPSNRLFNYLYVDCTLNSTGDYGNWKAEKILKSCIGYQLLTLLFLRFLAEEDRDHVRLNIMYIQISVQKTMSLIGEEYCFIGFVD